ncbi:MAG: methyltransferase domain-containing protein [Nitratireductor sp.]
MKHQNACRCCKSKNLKPFIDLGSSPPSNSYLSKDGLSASETWYPLRVKVCADCWLAQTDDFANREEFFNDNYAYFSSMSGGWLAHAKLYCENVINRFSLDTNSLVVEIASNDGYLLKNFVEKDIPCLGIEPSKSTADAARKIGVDTLDEFFGNDLAEQLKRQDKRADLVIGNNVFAHVPDIIDFAKGINTLLKDEGVVTLEFPHLKKLIDELQFDTVYHEHYSYLSLIATMKIFELSGLRVFDVEELSTHGGSLRVYGCKTNALHQNTERFEQVLASEKSGGLDSYQYYENMMARIEDAKNKALKFLIEENEQGRKVAGYGAAAKGNTFLNYSGIRSDLIFEIYDKALAKQGTCTPGMRIPIRSPEELRKSSPDTVVILPWNIASEIVEDFKDMKKNGTKFVRLLPEVEYL